MACFLVLAGLVFLSGQGGPAAAAKLGRGLKGAVGTEQHAPKELGNTLQGDCDLASDLNNTLQRTIWTNQVALFGWSRCPCTGIAHKRLVDKQVCFAETVWHDNSDPTFKYLQCVFGSDRHSFLFFQGEFKGNGFALLEENTNDTTLNEWLEKAGALRECPVEGQKSLSGGPLQQCSGEGEGVTGYTRHGTCEWQLDDAGYHQVCVKMSQTFLTNSRDKDGNDLSSVVQENGHWCICAWAFASAVHRNKTTLEGLELDCDRTNLKLVDVYRKHETLSGPTQSYEVGPALQKVFELCPLAEEAANNAERTS